MSRVLIWRKMSRGNQLDIFHPTEYEKLYDHVIDEWSGQCQNWGNRVWFQGIYSVLNNGENTYDFLEESIDIDRINKKYDFIILSLANVFCVEYVDGLRNYAEMFEQIKIPVYVIACGVQAGSYDELGNIVKLIGTEAKRFIRAIYNTGGEFALRGYFTKEFFDKLGFYSAVVTGCPSLYQLGSSLKIDNPSVDTNNLKPVFNGHIKSYLNLMKEYPQSVYIDQDELFYPLFKPNYFKDCDLRFKLNFINSYGIEAAELLAQKRICMIADTNEWWNYLKDKQFEFSFGSRIHGTIMAILSGVPSTIVACDSRTREMAEYFDIPMILSKGKPFSTKKELEKIYLEMDYTKFNSKFKHRFEAYEKFFVDHHIVSHLNGENTFFIREEGKASDMISGINSSDFEMFYKILKKNDRFFNVANTIYKAKRRIWK